MIKTILIFLLTISLLLGHSFRRNTHLHIYCNENPKDAMDSLKIIVSTYKNFYITEFSKPFDRYGDGNFTANRRKKKSRSDPFCTAFANV